jgi:hypothetical protein
MNVSNFVFYKSLRSFPPFGPNFCGVQPLPVVSARLGHSSVKVTAEVYAHMINGQDDDAADQWDDFQQKNSPGKRVGDVQ